MVKVTPYICMTDLETGKKMATFPTARTSDMGAITRELNRLNEEAARMTGRAIRYCYTIAFKVIK